MSGSRLPGFYKLSVAERRALVAERSGVDAHALSAALDSGGIDCTIADKLVENVLGTYALPFGVALNVQVNGKDRLVPMVVEEPSVIAAASNAARMVRNAGGFTAEMSEALMISQIELRGLSDVELALRRLETETEHLLSVARGAVPNLLERGGGPRSIELRRLENGRVVLHVLVDCKDAMGANLVNSIAEAVGPVAAGITGAELGLRILSNLSDRRAARVSCRVHPTDLMFSRGKPGPGPGDSAPPSDPPGALSGDSIADGIVAASQFAEADPYRAATHNKGIMNGIDAVVIATGNDFRAVEAGAHAYAALSGRYRPLSVWRLGHRWRHAPRPSRRAPGPQPAARGLGRRAGADRRFGRPGVQLGRPARVGHGGHPARSHVPARSLGGGGGRRPGAGGGGGGRSHQRGRQHHARGGRARPFRPARNLT
jgi:hydroxymethylglutaryl-CoA reductase